PHPVLRTIRARLNGGRTRLRPGHARNETPPRHTSNLLQVLGRVEPFRVVTVGMVDARQPLLREGDAMQAAVVHVERPQPVDVFKDDLFCDLESFKPRGVCPVPGRVISHWSTISSGWDGFFDGHTG